MGTRILFGGEVAYRTVFTDRELQKTPSDPKQGDFGYLVAPTGEVTTLVFSERYQVWHSPGLCLERYRDVLESKRVCV